MDSLCFQWRMLSLVNRSKQICCFFSLLFIRISIFISFMDIVCFMVVYVCLYIIFSSGVLG